MNITLLENHWYDATFSPSARFGATDHEDEGGVESTDERGEEPTHEANTARRVALAGMIPLVVASIAGGALAVRRVRARRAALDAERRRIEVDAIEYANAIAE